MYLQVNLFLISSLRAVGLSMCYSAYLLILAPLPPSHLPESSMVVERRLEGIIVCLCARSIHAEWYVLEWCCFSDGNQQDFNRVRLEFSMIMMGQSMGESNTMSRKCEEETKYTGGCVGRDGCCWDATEWFLTPRLRQRRKWKNERMFQFKSTIFQKHYNSHIGYCFKICIRLHFLFIW